MSNLFAVEPVKNYLMSSIEIIVERVNGLRENAKSGLRVTSAVAHYKAKSSSLTTIEHHCDSASYSLWKYMKKEILPE